MLRMAHINILDKGLLQASEITMSQTEELC